ncbi:MAG: hypothetical protein ACLPSW_29600 [Roseiarcus sp.]
MDDYSACWSEIVTALSIDKPGKAKDRETKRLMRHADQVCGPQSDVAVRVDGLRAVKDMRQYMAVQFYNANFEMEPQ